MNFKSLLKTAFPILGVFVVIAILSNTEAFGQLQPQSNPFGTRGDTALGGFGSNILTIVNAIAFYGGIVCVFWAVFNISTSKPWLPQALGAIGGVGGWTFLGAVAYQLGSNQAFQIPGIS